MEHHKNVITDDSIAPGEGIDSFFDSLSDSLFSSDESRESRVTALRTAVQTLQSAPNPNDTRIQNLGCFLAGLWSLPTTSNARSAIETMNTALVDIQTEIANTGDCGSTDNLETAVTDVQTISEDLSLIALMTSNCTLFSTDGSSASQNSIERSLAKFTDAADRGCEPSACSGSTAVCNSLQNSCVQSNFSTNAEGFDNNIETCEILYGCADANTCF